MANWDREYWRGQSDFLGFADEPIVLEAAVVGAILTDRRFHVEVAEVEVDRDRAAVERFGL